MSVSTLIKRASLDDAFDASAGATTPTSLRAKLRAEVTTARAAVATGQVVANVSMTNGAGGRSTGFSAPSKENFNGLTPVSMFEMWQELVDLFDDAKASLGGTPTDTQVYAEMKGLLKPCTEIGNDFSRLIVGRDAA